MQYKRVRPESGLYTRTLYCLFNFVDGCGPRTRSVLWMRLAVTETLHRLGLDDDDDETIVLTAFQAVFTRSVTPIMWDMLTNVIVTVTR